MDYDDDGDSEDEGPEKNYGHRIHKKVDDYKKYKKNYGHRIHKKAYGYKKKVKKYFGHKKNEKHECDFGKKGKQNGDDDDKNQYDGGSDDEGKDYDNGYDGEDEENDDEEEGDDDDGPSANVELDFHHKRGEGKWKFDKKLKCWYRKYGKHADVA